MTNIYFTITGTGYYHGKDFFEKDMEVILEKEKDNKSDKEAILVKVPGIGEVGHVANSPHTVIGDSMSAGRLYDKFKDTAKGIVRFNLSDGVLCQLILEKKKKK